MSKSNPLKAKSSGTDANAAVQSALRTLEAGGSGITALAPEVQSQYFWHQGTEWSAERRAAAIDCLQALLR